MADALYTLHIICPHCAAGHAITEWPVTEHQPFLFTCQPTRGGCGGQALAQPPDATTIPSPFLESVFVCAEPLTPQQAAWLLRKHSTPPPGA